MTAAVFGAVLLLGMAVPAARAQIALLLAIAVMVHAGAGIAITLRGLRRHALTLQDVGLHRPRWRLLHLLWQIPLTLLVIGLVNLIVLGLLMGQEPGGGGDTIAHAPTNHAALIAALSILGAAVLTPMWEELFFRGLVMTALRDRYPLPTTIAVSAGIFAVAHIAPPLMPYLLVMGVLLALIRLFHRNLLASILTHMVVNAAASSALIAALF